ncbi:MAG: calcium/sodium antiporter [Lachnospiraceae bacterium]|nr:calcium/sodium antiporter [Lachnospiraceae bacterium]
MSPVLSMLIAIVVLLVGFVLLIKGADIFVEGSSTIAKMLRVPPMVIGLTVVAMGTSLPELAVSITASISNSNSLAVSNVSGSNLFNLLVVLGFSALLVPLVVDKNTLKTDFPISMICALILLIFGWTGGGVERWEGGILLALFVVYIIYTVRRALKSRAENKAEEGEKKTSIVKSLIFVALGIVMIKFGGDMVVGGTITINGLDIEYGATAIARALGMSETLIGLTIVALGTSLPEFVTSIVAAKKGQVDMAVGNVIGSNIFNILLILGMAAAISPVTFITENAIDIAILVAASALVYLFAWSKEKIVRWEGALMILGYAGFMVYAIVR